MKQNREADTLSYGEIRRKTGGAAIEKIEKLCEGICGDSVSEALVENDIADN